MVHAQGCKVPSAPRPPPAMYTESAFPHPVGHVLGNMPSSLYRPSVPWSPSSGSGHPHDSCESHPGPLALFCWVLDPLQLPFLTPVCGTLLSDGQTLVSSSLFRTQILQPAREERLNFTHWKELESCLSVELGGRIKVPNWLRVGAVNKTPLPPPHPSPTHSWHLDHCLLRCESRRILPTVVVAARFIEALRKAQSWWPCCWSFKIGSDENFPFWKDCVSWRSHGSCFLFKKSIPVPNPTSHG